ncbi:MAG: hypothetical protein LBB24_02225 [Rickettsiales bacterium]|jgi:hypothetical protein|nr:hypothetical protein [Rickettsiales bacterium]
MSETKDEFVPTGGELPGQSTFVSVADLLTSEEGESISTRGELPELITRSEFVPTEEELDEQSTIIPETNLPGLNKTPIFMPEANLPIPDGLEYSAVETSSPHLEEWEPIVGVGSPVPAKSVLIGGAGQTVQSQITGAVENNIQEIPEDEDYSGSKIIGENTMGVLRQYLQNATVVQSEISALHQDKDLPTTSKNKETSIDF